MISINRICFAGAVACAIAAALVASGFNVSWHARRGADVPAEVLHASND